MKKLMILMVFVLAMTLLVGCNWLDTFLPTPDPPAEVLSANVIVVEWTESGAYPDDSINIEYLITNTGTVDIDFSRILFEVTYGDVIRNIYVDWVDGIGVEVGCYESGYVTEFWVGSREVVDVVAVDWELASYDE